MLMESLNERLLSILFPRRCVLCRKILPDGVTELCFDCRKSAPFYPYSTANPPKSGKRKYPFLDSFNAVWYYEGDVRKSLLRYKFHNTPQLSVSYSSLLAKKLKREGPKDIQIITWVPVSRRRKFFRGYDQSQLIAEGIGRELGIPSVPLLQKVRNNIKQSRLHSAEARLANVSGAYHVISDHPFQGAKIILVDDILTTGATVQECAKILKLAGAGEVHCAAVAAVRIRKKPKR